ncbi:ATPases involved in biogenesis of archaeal flagella [Legionella sainthelensi]|nr:ATPases involved in biogenesis of archaeal flagella [Legionella sainthelensi]
MNYLIRIMLLWCGMTSAAFTNMLEINIDGKHIHLPCWFSQKKQLGAILLVNGESHNQSSALLEYLAHRLAENGWMVTLVQDDKSNSIPWIKQLPEAIVTLRQQKFMKIVVLHYGEQLQQTLNYFGKPQAPKIEGLILLSAYNVQNPIRKKPEINMPIFDIIGQFDHDLVKQELAIRQKTLGNNKKKYLAIEIPGVEPDYKYSRQLLFTFIHGWMIKLPEFQPSSPSFMYTYQHPLLDFQSKV